jgi:hypothetical protein
MADEPGTEKDFAVSLGGRAWATTGFASWEFRGRLMTDGPVIDPVSELRWSGLESIVPELSAELRWKRVLLLASLGGGFIDEGTLVDNDFSMDGQRGRFSRTTSAVTDDGLLYVNADIGVRVLTWAPEAPGGPGWLDLLVGYQYWREEYVAFGVRGVQDLAPFGEPGTSEVDIARSVKAFTDDFSWHSVRIGGRARVPLLGRTQLMTTVLFLPWTQSRHEDTHHLRDDLAQDPSFVSTAEGGFGVQLDGALAYQFASGVAIQLGYRYWHIDSGDGKKITRLAGGGTVRDHLNAVTIERHGPYLELSYRF